MTSAKLVRAGTRASRAASSATGPPELKPWRPRIHAGSAQCCWLRSATPAQALLMAWQRPGSSDEMIVQCWLSIADRATRDSASEPAVRLGGRLNRQGRARRGLQAANSGACREPLELRRTAEANWAAAAAPTRTRVRLASLDGGRKRYQPARCGTRSRGRRAAGATAEGGAACTRAAAGRWSLSLPGFRQRLRFRLRCRLPLTWSSPSWPAGSTWSGCRLQLCRVPTLRSGRCRCRSVAAAEWEYWLTRLISARPAELRPSLTRRD